MQPHSKEGITPLMIGFLLVSFAVAVSVVVMNLGSAEVEEAAECAVDVGLRFSKIGGEEQVCYDAAKKYSLFLWKMGLILMSMGLW